MAVAAPVATATERKTNPRPSSSSNTTKKQQHRKSLRDVYEREREKALEFMDAMVSAPRIEIEDPALPHPPTKPQTQAQTLQKTKSAVTATATATATSNHHRRYEEFLSHLYKVWIKVDVGGEEEITVDRFKLVFHEVTSARTNGLRSPPAPEPFSAADLDACLSSLCDEGREVMLSDGMLYRIN